MRGRGLEGAGIIVEAVQGEDDRAGGLAGSQRRNGNAAPSAINKWVAESTGPRLAAWRTVPRARKRYRGRSGEVRKRCAP